METKEYRTIDKSDWGPGAWQNEPDKMQWRDEATGFPCLIVRSPLGNLCGYVGITEGHPWFGKDYNRGKVTSCDGCDHENDYHYACTPAGNLRVHGGITYSDFCQPSKNEAKGICHLPSPGEPDHVYWFGFDCGHCDDLSPTMERRLQMFSSDRLIYRDLAYVREQVASLALQLKEASSAST
jgi:hypothetical protein